MIAIDASTQVKEEFNIKKYILWYIYDKPRSRFMYRKKYI